MTRKQKIDLIVYFSAKEFDISVDDIYSKKRANNVVYARQIATTLIKQSLPLMTFRSIGDNFDQHHSTVFNAMKHVSDLYASNNDFKQSFDNIQSMIHLYLIRSGRFCRPIIVRKVYPV